MNNVEISKTQRMESFFIIPRDFKALKASIITSALLRFDRSMI